MFYNHDVTVASTFGTFFLSERYYVRIRDMNGTKETTPYIYIIFYVPFVVIVPNGSTMRVTAGTNGGTLWDV